MKKIFFTIFSLLFVFNTIAQEIINEDSRTWFLLLNRLTINEKWSVTNEVHERTNQLFSDQGQFLIRPSIDYHLIENAEFSFGYTYVHMWPSEADNIQLENHEHNVWEQINFKFHVGKFEMQNRLRQEHRWVGNITNNGSENKVDGTNYSNRFRFRLTISRDVYQFENKETTLFINAFDELWINQNSRLLPTDFTRNWLYVGAGIAFKKNTKLQFGYMSQFDYISTDKYSSTPILLTTFVKNFGLN